jgi:DMSO reductase anchor subunit
MFRIFLFNSVRTISVIPIPAIYHLMLTYHSTFTPSAFFLTTIIYQGSLFYILLYSTMAASYVRSEIKTNETFVVLAHSRIGEVC